MAQSDPSGEVIVTAQNLVAHARLFDPFAVTWEVTGPLRLVLHDGAIAGQMTSLSGVLRWLPGRVQSVTFAAVGVHVQDSSGPFAALAGTQLSDLNAMAERAPPEGAWRLDLRLASGRLPFLDQLLGSPEAFEVRIAASISPMIGEGAGGAAGSSASLDAWRDAGGILTLEIAELTKGGLRGQGQGTLGLDSERRLAGAMSGRIAGLEPLLRSTGLKTGSPTLDTVIRAMAARAPSSGVPFALQFREGRAYLGPLRTNLELRPLY